MTELMYTLQDFSYWIFENTLEPLGNLPNWSFIGLGFVGLLFWLRTQKKFNEEAKANGTLK